MIALLLALLLLTPGVGHGHGHGHGHKHHHRNPCVVFRVGCPSDVQVPAPPFTGPPPNPFGAGFAPASAALAPASAADVDSGWFHHSCFPSNFEISMSDRVVWHASSGVRTVWYWNGVYPGVGGVGYVDSLGIWARSLPDGTWVRKWYTEDSANLNPSNTYGVDVTVAGSGQVHAFKTRVYASGFMCEATVIDN